MKCIRIEDRYLTRLNELETKMKGESIPISEWTAAARERRQILEKLLLVRSHKKKSFAA